MNPNPEELVPVWSWGALVREQRLCLLQLAAASCVFYLDSRGVLDVEGAAGSVVLCVWVGAHAAALLLRIRDTGGCAGAQGQLDEAGRERGD